MVEDGMIVRLLGDASGVERATATASSSLARFSDVAQKEGRKSGLAVYYARDAVMDLGHVARDLPYAANNIAILAGPIGKITTLFNSLRQETGSFQGAIGALGSALSGGGGLVIGIELVTSALAFFGGQMMGAGENAVKTDADLEALNKRLTDSKERMDELAKSIEYIDKLGAINIEIAGLPKTLDFQARGIEIRDQLVAQQDETKKLQQAYSEAIALNQKKQTEESQKTEESALSALRESQGKEKKLGQDEVYVYAQLNLQKKQDAEKALKETQEQYSKDEAALKKHLAELKRLHDEELRREKERNDARTFGITEPDFADQYFADQAAKLPPDQMNKDLRRLIENGLGNRVIKPRINIAPNYSLVTNKDLQGINNIKDSLQARLNTFSDELGKLVKQSEVQLITNMAEGIGQAISSGNFGDVFSTIASVIGGFIQQLGEYLITAAIATKEFKDAFKFLIAHPALGIAVGAALVILGGVIKSSVPKPKGFAQGGLVSGATMGLVGEGIGTSASNPEIIAPLDKLKNYIGGGEKFPNYLPVVNIGYDQLRVMYARANKQGGRY